MSLCTYVLLSNKKNTRRVFCISYSWHKCHSTCLSDIFAHVIPRMRYRGRTVGTSLHSPCARAVLLSCSFKDKRTKETKDLAIEKYVLLYFCPIKKNTRRGFCISYSWHKCHSTCLSDIFAHVTPRIYHPDVPLVRPYLSPIWGEYPSHAIPRTYRWYVPTSRSRCI